jgi:hypothetical protein
LAGDLRVASTAAPFSAQGEGVQFHEARLLSDGDIIAVQNEVRTRVTLVCSSAGAG